MTAPLPLITGFDAQRPLAWGSGGLVTHGRFVAQAQSLAAALPRAGRVINLCEDRYRFSLVFAAAALRGSVNLLPSSGARAVTDALAARFADAICLDDAAVAPHERVTDSADAAPLLPAAQIVATAFTSGSTGVSQPHPKRWDTLVQTARLAAERFLASQPHSIVATVPPQHLYGLDTTVLMALAAGCPVHAGRPFFPHDVAAALQAVPAPRLLITTPVHLRALVTAQVRLPAVALTISATAPLAAELARAAEALLGGPVREIFGCTEAGSMASRRTVDSDVWQLYPGMRIAADGDGATVTGEHLPDPVPLADVVEILAADRFRVVGRGADQLKVAGKRGSLGELTQKLLAIPGVVDGVVFLADDGALARPAALVVAPTLSEAAILEALRLQVDPVFLPRPLKRVAQLPRNAVGKLPRAELLAALQARP